MNFSMDSDSSSDSSSSSPESDSSSVSRQSPRKKVKVNCTEPQEQTSNDGCAGVLMLSASVHSNRISLHAPSNPKESRLGDAQAAASAVRRIHEVHWKKTAAIAKQEPAPTKVKGMKSVGKLTALLGMPMDIFFEVRV